MIVKQTNMSIANINTFSDIYNKQNNTDSQLPLKCQFIQNTKTNS